MTKQHRDDAALERELERALAVDPSPEFQARVRLHIANQPLPARWDWRWVALVTASAAVAVFAVLVLMWRPAPPTEVVSTNGTDTVLPREVRPTPQPPQVEPAPARREPAIARVARRVEPRPSAVVEDVVLIPAGEAAALRRLMRGLPRGRVEPSTAAQTAGVTIAAVRHLDDITVAPLAPLATINLEPLRSRESEKGVRQ